MLSHFQEVGDTLYSELTPYAHFDYEIAKHNWSSFTQTLEEKTYQKKKRSDDPSSKQTNG